MKVVVFTLMLLLTNLKETLHNASRGLRGLDLPGPGGGLSDLGDPDRSLVCLLSLRARLLGLLRTLTKSSLLLPGLASLLAKLESLDVGNATTLSSGLADGLTELNLVIGRIDDELLNGLDAVTLDAWQLGLAELNEHLQLLLTPELAATHP